MSNKTEKNSNTITLDEPLVRADKTITEINLRKPNSGALRGIGLLELAQMDVSALEKLLPRITEPTLTKDEVAKLCPADLMQLGVKVANFLLTKQQQADYPNE